MTISPRDWSNGVKEIADWGIRNADWRLQTEFLIGNHFFQSEIRDPQSAIVTTHTVLMVLHRAQYLPLH